MHILHISLSSKQPDVHFALAHLEIARSQTVCCLALPHLGVYLVISFCLPVFLYSQNYK